jgi:damage-control phosphatase, subfamily III
LIQGGFASQVRFHGKRYPWFVSDVTKKDWEWLLNSMVYGHLFPEASELERESLRTMGRRWKVWATIKPKDRYDSSCPMITGV